MKAPLLLIQFLDKALVSQESRVTLLFHAFQNQIQYSVLPR